MKSLAVLFILALTGNDGIAGEFTTRNTRQSYSGKIGFYNPGEGLNNGLLFGVDGITEFVHYRLILTGAVDLYPKQSIDIFRDPQPDGRQLPSITQQQMILLPLHANIGYKLIDIEDADTRVYAGLGGGYYFFFYSTTYRASSGGILGGSLVSTSASKNGGGGFGTASVRVLINQVFIESRFYLASKTATTIDGYSIVVDPTGFAITLGFQSF